MNDAMMAAKLKKAMALIDEVCGEISKDHDRDYEWGRLEGLCMSLQAFIVGALNPGPKRP